MNKKTWTMIISIVAFIQIGLYIFLGNTQLGTGIMTPFYKDMLIAQAEDILDESLVDYEDGSMAGVNNEFFLFNIRKGIDRLRVQGKCKVTCELEKIGREVKGIRKVVYSSTDEDVIGILEKGPTHSFLAREAYVEKGIVVEKEIAAKKEKDGKIKKEESKKLLEGYNILIKKEVEKIIYRRDAAYRKEFEPMDYDAREYDTNNMVTIEIAHKSLSTEEGISDEKNGISNFEKYLVYAQCEITCSVKSIAKMKNEKYDIIYEDEEDKDTEWIESRKNTQKMGSETKKENTKTMKK